VAVAAAAAITAECHAAEALLEVDTPQGAMPGVDTPAVDMPGVAMLELEWGRLALDGTALTEAARGTVAAIGTAPIMAVIGMAATTGMAIIGMATTGTATTGTAIIGIIIMAIVWSSSAALAFRTGGAGGPRGAGTTATHTAIILMAMVAPTVTGTVTAVTPMVMATDIIMDMATEATDTAPSTSLATETAANPESASCNGGCHELAIIMDPSTASWGRKRGAQSGRTSKTTMTRVNLRHSGQQTG